MLIIARNLMASKFRRRCTPRLQNEEWVVLDTERLPRRVFGPASHKCCMKFLEENRYDRAEYISNEERVPGSSGER